MGTSLNLPVMVQSTGIPPNRPFPQLAYSNMAPWIPLELLRLTVEEAAK